MKRTADKLGVSLVRRSNVQPICIYLVWRVFGVALARGPGNIVHWNYVGLTVKYMY